MNRRARVALAVLVALLATSAPGPASAHEVSRPEQRQGEIQAELRSLQGDLDEAAAEEAALLADYQATKARREGLAGRLHIIDGDVAAARAALGDAQGRLDRAEGEYLRAGAELRTAERLLAEATDRLEVQAVAAYTGGGSLGLVSELLTSVQDPAELHAGEAYVHAVLDAQQDVVAEHQRLRVAREAISAKLEDARARALADRDVLAEREERLAGARAEQAHVLAEVDTEAARETDLLEQVHTRQAEYEARIANLTAESDSIEALLRDRQSGQGLVVPGDGVLANPIPGAPVTSLFGPRVHPIYGTTRMHTGIDLGAPSGTPIRAADDGFVVAAGWRGGYGLATIIDHGGSLATLYAHQSRLGVFPGQRVRRGEVIGYVGSTGYSTGPHLHFEVRVAGNPVDPLQYL